MKVKFKPLHDRILVLPAKPEEKKGLIVIPDTAKEEELIGEVIAVGPGRKDGDGKTVPMSTSPGQTVLFQRYCGFDIELDAGENKDGKSIKTGFKVIEESDVLGVIG